MSRRGGGVLRTVALVLAFLLAACGEDGPSGPGTLDVRVSAATELGAAVLLVEGDGVAAFEGVGDTRVFEGPVIGGGRRIILVGEGAGELRFRLDVTDRGSSNPRISVVSAVDTANETVPAVSAVDVRITSR